METQARHATLEDLATMLTEQQARKHDMVVPATKIHMEDGLLHVAGQQATLSEDGVTLADGIYRPTKVFDEGIAAKLNIPLAYVRRLREERTDLYDVNVNGWLHGNLYAEGFENPDSRKFLVRGFKPDTEGEEGIARAFLSDTYKIVDNLDVLTTALEGIREAGVQVYIHRCDLTDRRMVVSVTCPEIQVVAEELLRGYRNPFSDDLDRWRPIADREGLGYGGEEPVLYAGFKFSNSETGGGAFSVVPEARVKVCANGLTFTKDLIRAVHLGGRMEEGLIDWSADTMEKQLALIKARTRDAVRTFLSAEYLANQVKAMEEKSGKPVSDMDQVKTLTKGLGCTQEQIDGVLGHFIKGGQMTLGGVMNAVTSYAQTVPSGDEQYELEAKATSLLI